MLYLFVCQAIARYYEIVICPAPTAGACGKTRWTTDSLTVAAQSGTANSEGVGDLVLPRRLPIGAGCAG